MKHDRPLPGDEVIPDPGLVMDRLLHLDAAPEVVWPWLVQLGKRRAGWYLPRAVEIVIPRARRADWSIGSRWQQLAVGDEIPDWGPDDPTFRLIELDPGRHLVYWSQRPRSSRGGQARPPMRLTWALALEPTGTSASLLRLRLRLDLGTPPGPVATYGGGFLDWFTIELLGRGLNQRLHRSRR